MSRSSAIGFSVAGKHNASDTMTALSQREMYPEVGMDCQVNGFGLIIVFMVKLAQTGESAARPASHGAGHYTASASPHTGWPRGTDLGTAARGYWSVAG